MTNTDKLPDSFNPTVSVTVLIVYSGPTVAQICPSSKPGHLLVAVPVQAAALQDEPVLLPALGEVGLGVLLLPEPALAVSLAQVLAGDASLAEQGRVVLGRTEAWKGGQRETH